MQKPTSPRVRAYLRTLENPYATDQLYDPTEEPAASSTTDGELSAHGEEERPRPLTEATGERASPTGTLSRADFRKRCREIFIRYIPVLEKRRLRVHHREFISRNEGRPGSERYRLWKMLSRYDLSDLAGLEPQFNRERDPFTEGKLRAIERSVDPNR